MSSSNVRGCSATATLCSPAGSVDKGEHRASTGGSPGAPVGRRGPEPHGCPSRLIYRICVCEALLLLIGHLRRVMPAALQRLELNVAEGDSSGVGLKSYEAGCVGTARQGAPEVWVVELGSLHSVQSNGVCLILNLDFVCIPL